MSRAGLKILSLCIVVIIGCVGCTTDPAPASARPGATNEVAVDATHGTTLDLTEGGSIDVPAGSVAGAGTLAGSIIAAPTPAPPGMILLGPTYDLQLRGTTLRGPITAHLHDTANRRSAENGPNIAVLGYLDTTSNTWKIVEGSYDQSAHALTATLPHLSIYSLLTVDAGKVLQAARSKLATILDTSDSAAQPTCPSNAKIKAGGASVTSDAGQIVRWCADGSDTGDVTLRLANNRHYAIETDYPSSWQMRRVGSSDSVVNQVVDSVAKFLSPAPPGGKVVIIPGGGSVEFTVAAGTGGVAKTSPSPPAYLASAFLYGLDTFAMTFKAIPGVPSPDPTRTAKAVSLVFDSKSCLTSFDSLNKADVSTADGVANLFIEDLKFATGCLGDQWGVAYGLTGAIGSFVVGTALWLVDGVVLVADGLRATIDSAMYWRTYRIAVRAGTPQNPVLGQVWGPYQEGYGSARPRNVFNGGDPTGLVANITWTSWGGPRAEGDGTSDYTGASQSVADGTQETAHIVAFNLGQCNGKLMYQAVEWYYPQHGERFDPGSYINICTGDYVGAR